MANKKTQNKDWMSDVINHAKKNKHIIYKVTGNPPDSLRNF